MGKYADDTQPYIFSLTITASTRPTLTPWLKDSQSLMKQKLISNSTATKPTSPSLAVTLSPSPARHPHWTWIAPASLCPPSSSALFSLLTPFGLVWPYILPHGNHSTKTALFHSETLLTSALSCSSAAAEPFITSRPDYWSSILFQSIKKKLHHTSEFCFISACCPEQITLCKENKKKNDLTIIVDPSYETDP